MNLQTSETRNMKNTNENKNDSIAYMYCPLTALLSIIKNGEIYASDPLKMNDSEELLWFLNECKHIDNYEQLLDLLGFEASIDKIAETILNNGQRNVFISCFSALDDSLSQWRGYGDDGKGVAIGFDIKHIAASYLSAVDCKIKYGIPSYNDIYEYFLEYNSFSDSIDNQKKQIALYNHLLFYSAQYKNPSFRDEKEIRIIFEKYNWLHNVRIEAESLQNSNPYFKTDYRLINNDLDITEYAKIQLPPKNIKRIVIGPKCKLKVNELKGILNYYLGYIPDVAKSISPYK